MRTTNSLQNSIKGLVITTTLLASGCGSKEAVFSLMPEQMVVEQTTSYVPRKIDILWVIDNSGSMETSQANVANNLNRFMNRFQSLGYDFHIGVTGTDAYRALFESRKKNLSLLRDGYGATHSGVFVLEPSTPNLLPTFMTNVTLGINGTGDERAFSSFKATLNDPLNSAFRRPDAFLAIIIVSDEDDFSLSGATYMGRNYDEPTLLSLQSFKDYLDTLTGTTVGSNVKNYSVNAITVQTQECADLLNSDGFDRIVGKRYMELADLTGGVQGSLCGDFGESLELISGNIIQNTATFPLNRQPNIDTLQITVNGNVVPQDSTNGWTYNAETNSIEFHGSAIPTAGSQIGINFDPTNIQI